MNSKLIIALAAILALSSVNAQVPALVSLSSKIESLSASASGPGRTPLIQSAESAYSRISSEIAASSAAGAGATTSGSSAASTAASSAASESLSASSVASSASSAASSAASHESSAGGAVSSASSVAQSNAPNAGTSLIGNGYSALFVQFAALSALFIASFVAMLA
ncbi:hypothetical protein MFLAVUS_001025 [Mucor flavus]|uniref:Uncharacterized protein n=1 Tax=Mucor flavus TaxID=439312 RepID=A0ABP9YLC4_9FUNG